MTENNSKQAEPETLPYQSGLFKNRNIVITGAGRGIGAAIANYLQHDGANIVAHLGRSENQTLWQFPDNSSGSGSITQLTGDLSTNEGVERFVEQTKAQFGFVDLLVNNAGTMLGRVPSSDMTAAHYHKVTDLNAKSVVLVTTGLLALLGNANSASIVNVTSISADTGGSPGGSIYSAAKGFVSTYTRSLATELAPQGIRVNAISPGTIDTDFHQRYSSEEKLNKTAANTPLKRLGTANDCVGACLFLAAPELSGFITGQILGINGGMSYV